MPTSDEIAISDVISRFGDCWNRHDMHAFAALFTEDANFVDVFGNWFKSRREIERALSVRHQTVFKDSRFTKQEVAIRVLTSDVAMVHAIWELSGAADSSGRPLPPGLGLMTYVLSKVAEQTGGSWHSKTPPSILLQQPLNGSHPRGSDSGSHHLALSVVFESIACKLIGDGPAKADGNGFRTVVFRP